MGCLKNIFAMVGCTTVLLVAGIFGWQYRVQLWNAYEAFRASEIVAPQSAAAEPSDDALQSATRKHAQIAEAGGPGYVVLLPDEMASLVREGLHPEADRALDSLRVSLQDDRLVLEADLLTDVWGRRTLGPFAGILEPRERLRVAGPARVESAGVMAWTPDEFVVRSLPFPEAAISSLVNSLTRGADGAIRFAIPSSVGDVAVRPEGVTFYKRVP
jgi:hypothetical protein